MSEPGQDEWLATKAARKQAALDEAARAEAVRQAALSDAVIERLRTLTPAQVEAYVRANVTDLPSAQNFLVKVALALQYLVVK